MTPEGVRRVELPVAGSILEELGLFFADSPNGFVEPAKVRPDDLFGVLDTPCEKCICEFPVVL